jgi:hypothetical protein
MIFQIDDTADEIYFPDPHLGESDGCFAVGGDLSIDRLLLAYSNGIFPWYSFRDQEEPLWFCPMNRFVIFPDEIHVSHSMRTLMNKNRYSVGINEAFDQVIMDKLPAWVSNFNRQNLPKKYLSEKWNTLYPIDTYKQSTADDTNYEREVKPGVKPVLPLDLPALYKKYGYDILRSTPFGNSYTLEMAKAAIAGENLGGGNETDFLAVSCSCTDVIGHQVGPNAVEIEDTYLRLDKDFADFFNYLDQKVGKGNYTVFLSADHGGMNNAQFLLDRRIPAGDWNTKTAQKDLNEMLKAKYPSAGDLVKWVSNYQVFFDTQKIDSLSLDYNAIKQDVVNRLKKDKRVQYACDMEKASIESIPEEIKYRIINGYNRERSGGVQVILKPAYYSNGMKGTTHGAWNGYDTHIPLVFMGWGIQHGASTKPCYMTDIAPTVCALLHIQAPNGCIGTPIF